MRNKKVRAVKTRLGLIFLGLLIVGGALLVWWSNRGAQVSAAWFDDNWGYRKTITLTVASSASDITGLDTLVTIDTTGITDKLQTACQDLRFTNQGGDELPFYIDTCNDNSASNKVWIRADLVPKNTTTYTIYMYYGNPSAQSASNSTLFALYNGLMSYWTMNESSWTNNCSTATVVDSSVNGSSTTSCPNSTGPTGGVSSKFANGGTFDGSNDYLDAGNGSGVNLGTSDFTINLWIKRAIGEATSTDGDAPIGKGDWSSSKGWAFFVNRDGGLVEFQAYDSSTKSQYYSNYASTLNDNTWHMLTIVQDRDVGGIFYIDGVQRQTNSTTFTGDINSATSLLIGHNRNGVDYYHGGLDDVRMYNRILSQSEITELLTNPGAIATNATATSKPTTSFSAEEKALTPVAYWKFDEGTGTAAKDSSSNGNNATLAGAALPTWQTADLCMSQKCLYFGGSTSYLNAGNSTSLNPSALTFSAWVKANANSSDYEIISKQYGTSTNVSFLMKLNSGVLQFTVCNSGATCVATLDPSGALPISSWYYVTGTYDGSTAKLYKNGVLIHEKVGSVTIGYDTNPIFIGARSIDSTTSTPDYAFFNGFIDEPKIFNYVRSADQIKLDYNSKMAALSKGAGTLIGGGTNAAFTDGLLGYWKVNESSGNAADSSGNGLTLTNNGTTTYVAGKFGNGSEHVPASSQYLSTGTTITGVKTVSFWTNPDSTTNYFVSLTSGAYVTATSGVLTATGFTAPKIYVNGVASTTIVADVWQLITITSETATNANQFYVGRQGSNYYDGTLDEIRTYNRVLSPSEIAQLALFGPGPVGYWNFEESAGSTSYDISSSGNNGTWSGTGATRYLSGQYGKAANFNGTDDYIFNSSAAPTTTVSNWTMEAWIKPANLSQLSLAFYNGNDSGGYGFGVGSGGGGAGAKLQILFGGVAWIDPGYTFPAANVWYHIAMARDGTTTRTYVNGVQLTTTSAQTPGSVVSRYSIGMQYSNANAATRFFSGAIDEAKIYNYTRTQKQIIEDMNGSHPIGGSPVGSQVGYWKFDEGQGTVANDSSFQRNNGAITGMASPASVGISGWNPSGKVNKSLSFDGSDDTVTVTTNSALSITGELTISAWIKMRTTAIDERVIISKWNSTGNQRGYALTLNSTDKVCLAVDNDGATGNIDTGCSTTSLAQNTWYYVSAVYTPSTSIAVYVNGNLDNVFTSGIDSAIFASTANFLVGGSVSGFSSLFTGDVDEVKVYNSALTQSDINIDYNLGQSLRLGSLGTSGDGVTASNSASAAYCVPGSTTSCATPVAEWRFEEKQGTTANDTSGNAYSGTLTSSPVWTTGKIGTALDFDGSASHVVVDKSGLNTLCDYNVNTGFTIQSWFFFDSSAGNQTLVGFGSSSSGTPFCMLSSTTGGIRFEYRSDNNTEINGGSAFITDETFVDGKWHHAAVVRSGSTFQIYVDGILRKSRTDTGFNTVSINRQTLGGSRRTGALENAFNGKLDQPTIYNYARSASQIAYDYNRGLPIAYYKMDECQGTQVYDSSGNGQSGTITGTVGTCTDNASTVRYNGRNGKYNASLSFNGSSDYVSIADSTTLRPTMVSLSAWFNLSGNPTQDTIISKAYTAAAWSSPYVSWLMRINSTSEVELDVGNGSNYSAKTFAVPTLLGSTWYHLVMTYDGTTLTGYLNGVKLGTSTAISGSIGYAAQPVIIGGDYSASPLGGYFPGQIDEVKIFGYALTDYQVRTEFNQGAAVRFGPLQGTP